MPLLTPHVPNGLIDLMKDLAKEVLRDKPENIYEFAVVHFEKLILERDGSLDKGYEEFSAFEAHFDGQQRFAVPSNGGYICQRPIKIQPIPQPKKSKSEIMASFQAMESINEEDALSSAAAPEGASPYADEKYQNAIYVIQRYFRRYMERKKSPSNTKNESLSAFTAAIIIQRTMRRLFSNKMKLTKNKEKDSGPSLVTTGAAAAAVKLVQDDMDNVSEAASYTSSSTIQMLADGQEGRENRLASGQSRRQHEEVLDGNGDGVVGDGNVGVVGAADCSSSLEFKEPTQDEEPPSTSSSVTAVMVADDDEEHSHSVVAATEMDRKSIADENGNTEPIPEEKLSHPSASTTDDDTSTAHNIGILLPTKIGSNYNHQNLPNNNTNNHNEIDINTSGPTAINPNQLNIIPAGLIVPLNYPQSSLGSTPDTLPVTSPHLEETQETFVVHSLHEYANENGKNNDASSYFQGDGRIRKFDSDTGESLKIYDVYYHDVNDQEFSDSLNESTMEKDSLEPEELDADSLESNENVVHHQHHMSDIVKRDARQDDGSLYGDRNDEEEGDEDNNDIAQNIQKFIEIERVPTYLYGIHPARTPVVERRNRNRNSEEGHKVPDEKKYLEATTAGKVDSRSPTEEKSEEESLESKGSTSEESSVTQIENNLELREMQNKDSAVKELPIEHGEQATRCPETTEKWFIEEHSNFSIPEGQLPHQTTPTGALNQDLETKESREATMSTTNNLKPNSSQQNPKKFTESGEDTLKQNETNLSEQEKNKNRDSKLEEESQKIRKTNQKSNDLSSSKLEDNCVLKEETTNLVAEPMILKKIDSSLEESLSNDVEKSHLRENARLSSVTTATEEPIDSKAGDLTKSIEDTTSKLEDNLRNNDQEELNLKEAALLASMKTSSKNLIDSERGVFTESIEDTTSKLEDNLRRKDQKEYNLKETEHLSLMKTSSKSFIDSERGILAESIEDTTSKLENSLRSNDLEESNSKGTTHLALETTPDKLIGSERAVLTENIEDATSKLEVSDNLSLPKEKIIKQSEKYSQSSENPCEAEQNKKDSSSGFEETTNLPLNYEPTLMQNTNRGVKELPIKHGEEATRCPGTTEKWFIEEHSNCSIPEGQLPHQNETGQSGKLSEHDQEIESQFQELQSLNDHLPGTNLHDTTSESHLRNKRSEDAGSHKISQHDDNNNLEESYHHGEDTNPNETNWGKSQDSEKSSIEENEDKLQKQRSVDMKTSKSLINAGKVLLASSEAEENKKSALVSSTISELSKEMNETIAGGDSNISEESGERHSSEHLPQTSEQKNAFLDSKSEDILEKPLEDVLNEDEVKITVKGSDSLKETSGSDDISDNSSQVKSLQSPQSEDTKPFTKEESLESSELKKSNRHNEQNLNLDQKESGTKSVSLDSPADLHSFEKSKTDTSIDNHGVTSSNEGLEEEKNSTNKKEISLMENELKIEEKLVNEARKSRKTLLEENAVKEVKNNTQKESNSSKDDHEDKDEITKLFKSKEPHTSENSSSSDNDDIISDKSVSNQSSHEIAAENLKEEEKSIKSVHRSTSEATEEAANVILEAEKSQSIKVLQSSVEKQSSLNPKQTKSTDQLQDLLSENTSPENIQDSNITKKIVIISSEKNRSVEAEADPTINKSDEDLKSLQNDKLDEGVASENKQIAEEKKLPKEEQTKAVEPIFNNIKSDQESIVVREDEKLMNKSDRSSTDTEIKIDSVSKIPMQEPGAADKIKSDQELIIIKEPNSVKTKKFDKEILSEERQLMEQKKPTEGEEIKTAEAIPNNINSHQDSIDIKEKVMKESERNSTDTVSETPIQDIAAFDTNISTEPSQSKKIEEQHSIPVASPDIVVCDGSSAETSADFSSIGKDLEFFEDTIKYLKNATEHLGGMEEVFDGKKKEDADVFNHSAVLIQSAFRGYQVRKGFKELNKGKSEAEKNRNKRSLDKKETDLEPHDEKKENAAIKIQSAYRGHRVRRDKKKKLNEKETERQQSSGSILPPPNEATNYIHSPSRNVLGSNLVKSQIPVAVIHPIKYSASMEEGHPEKVSEAEATNSRNESAVSSPSKQFKPSPTTSVKTIPKNMKTSPQKITRQKPLEKKPNVKNDHKEESPIMQKRSVEKNDQTFIRDPLDQTVKTDQTQIMGNKKLTIGNKSTGYGNKSKNNLKTKTPSTADSLGRPKGSTNFRDQFRRKGKSMSINGKTQDQESLDLETIKKELLSTTFKSPPQSGSKKKTGARVKSGKQRSPGKHYKGTKIPQKSPSKTIDITSKQIKQDELPSGSDTVSINGSPNSDLSKTITVELDQDKNLEETNNNTKKPTLSKTYTIRSSLNEVEHLKSPVQPKNEISESLFDSLKRDVDKLKANVHEKSAVTIQKTFRGYRTRKHLNEGLKGKTMGALDKSNLKTASVAQEKVIEALSKSDDKISSESQEATTKGILKEIEKGKEDNSVEERKKENSMKLADPALDEAAIKIQKTYRGYKTRKNYKKLNDKRNKLDTNEDTEDKTTTNLLIEPKKVLKKQLQQDGEIGSEKAISDSLEKSALTIQKTFRGYQSRKQPKSKKINKVIKNEDSHLKEGNARSKTPTDDLNMHSKLDDKPDEETLGDFESLQKSIKSYKNSLLHESATTIQKHYRGYKIRKEINTKNIRSGILKNSNVLDVNMLVNEDLNEIERKLIEHQDGIKKIGTKEEEEKQATSSLKTETGRVLTESEYKEIPEAVDQCKSADLDKSATTIQKNFRGYRTRKNFKKNRMVADHDPKQKIISEKEEKIEETTEKFKNHDDIKQHGVIDSFDVNKLQDETLQKSATTIQKTFRGYKTRKSKENTQKPVRTENLLHEPTEDQIKTLENEDTEKPVSAENLVHKPTEDETKTLANEASNKTVAYKQAETEQRIEKTTDTENLQQSAEDHTSTSKESSSPTKNIDIFSDVSSSEDVLKNIHSKSNYQKGSKKSSSAGAVLENAASTIQKAYRDYHAKKINNLPIKSYSNGMHRETIPKEILENSDESSTFIGPDTSFDLSDVESVETKSEKAFNSEKLNSSETHTPTNNFEEDPASTLNINILSEDQKIDNKSVNTPEKLRFKRSLIEPTAPPLDEILNAEEPVSASPKLKWFVGDDPIIPSNINSSESSSPASASSSSVDPLIHNYSKFNNLSSIDACGDDLHSNQQHLAPSINSAVVSTSSLLLANNTEKLKQNTLNNNSGIVSANEEETFNKEENNLGEIDQSEDTSKKLENNDDIASNVVKSNEKLPDDSETISEAKCKKDNEDKQEDTKEVPIDLCKNCAEGIREGGICSENLIKTPKNDQTVLDPMDPIKQFVLMEELKNDQSPTENSESSVISSQKEDELSTSGLDSTEITASDANNEASQNKVLTEQLNSSKDCPAISLIPPSSEDDTSERESSPEVNGAQHKDDRVKNEKSDKDQSEVMDQVKGESNEDIKRKDDTSERESSSEVNGAQHRDDRVDKQKSDKDQSEDIDHIKGESNEDTKSKDDTSERESSLDENGAQQRDRRIKDEKSDKDQSEDIDEFKGELNEDTKRKEEIETSGESKSVDDDTIKQTIIKTDEGITPESINEDLMVDTKEDKNTFEEKETILKNEAADNDASKTIPVSSETKSVDNSSINEKSKHSSNEIEEKQRNPSNFEEPLEDAFKTIPGEEFKTKQQGFEDDFSDSKEIEEASDEKQNSSELEEKALLTEEGKTGTDVKKEESLDTNKNEATSKDLENDKVNNGALEENSSGTKGIESKISIEEGSHELLEENEKLTDQKLYEETASKGPSNNKTEIQSLPSLELKIQRNASEEDTKLDEITASETMKISDSTEEKIKKQDSDQNEDALKEEHEPKSEKTEIKQVSKTGDDISSSLEDESSMKAEDKIVNSEVSKEEVQGKSDSTETKITKEDEKSFDSEFHEGKTTSILSKNKDHGQLQEDIEIAAKLIESSLSDPQAKLLENQSKSKDSTENNKINLDSNECSKINEEHLAEDKNQVEAKLEKLIEDNLKPAENIKNTVDLTDLPTVNSSQEVVEEPCVKTIIPPAPFSTTSSDPEESELESTTTKAESPTTTTPGYDETSETDAIDIPPSKPDALDAMTEKLREPEEMVARMRQRRASEHKISIDSLTDQQAVFEEPISQPIKPMQQIQKSSSTEVEDDFVLQKLERGDTTRESSAQSESVIYGDTTSQLTESEDTFNENLDLHSLHRMNTIAANRSTFKPPSHLYKSVTIDSTVKYIDPEKSTEESGSSFCLDDALSEDVRKKMMAYSVSEADSDYYEVGDQTTHPHDDFNISTALDNFPSTDTDTTIVSAATKIQAGARGFLTRRRIRRASMGTKASLNEERNLSFGNDAIGESLDQLAEEEDGRRQFNRQTGVNSLPSALEHSDEMLSPLDGDNPIGTITSPAKHFSIKIQDDKHIKGATSSAENDFNDWLEKPEHDSSHVVSNLEATLARRLTLQRGDAMRNDSTPDDENGNGKQVDLAKNNSTSSIMGTELFHEKTMVESTTTTTTRTTTERRNYSDAGVSNKKDKIKWFALRQNSMPVQIDSEIFRVLPKHMRKRIKSAEGEKPKRIRFPRD